jgi:hypothetical protein
MILSAKNTIIQNIRKTAMSIEVYTADQLRETILTSLLHDESVTNLAISYLKSEVKGFL